MPAASDTARIDGLLRAAADSGSVPGVVAAATTRDGLVYEGAFGRLGVADDRPMRSDSVFWIASMTKLITSVAAMQLVERGVLDLDTPLGDLAPELADRRILDGFGPGGEPLLRPAQRHIKLRHLLSHSSGLAEDIWSPLIERYARYVGLPPSGDRKLASLDLPLLFEPGSAWHYGINHEWVGLLIEKATGTSLDRHMKSAVFDAAGMVDTGWERRAEHDLARPGVQRRLAADQFVPVERILPPSREYLPGGGALYSTAADYLRFLRSLLFAGAGGENPLLRPETLAMMRTNQTGEAPVGRLRPTMPELCNDVDYLEGFRCCWGLGAQMNLEPLPDRRRAGSLSWGGLGNTYFWVDPDSGVGGVLLTQILPFGDPTVLDLCARFEAAIYETLGGARR